VPTVEHGTLNLFATLEISTGVIRTQKRRIEFLEFMDKLLLCLPNSGEIYVILDNYCIHKRNDTWLAHHPNVKFHFAPTSATWLNMVEIWFGIMSRKALNGASFQNIDQLKTAIDEFVVAYTSKAKPFIWRKRELKGCQLKNTIANLRN
jgi:transposase